MEPPMLSITDGGSLTRVLSTSLNHSLKHLGDFLAQC